MAEPRIIRVYYEGDDDRNFLEKLKERKLLPENWEIAQRDKSRPGKDGMVQDLAPFVRPLNGVGGSAVALADLDEQDAGQMRNWSLGQLTKYVAGEGIAITSRESSSPRVSAFAVSGGNRSSQVVFVAVGLSEDSVLCQTHGHDRFAMDDYVLRLVCDSSVYAGVSDFQEVPFDTAMKKLQEMASMLRSNQIPIRHTKRFLHLLRAITNFRPSSAAFVERVVGKALATLTEVRAREVLQPLIGDLEEVGKIISHKSPDAP